MDRLEFASLKGGEQFELETKSGSTYELAVELAPHLIGGNMFRGFRITRHGKAIKGEPARGLVSGDNIINEPAMVEIRSPQYGILDLGKRLLVYSDLDHEQNSGKSAFSPFVTSEVTSIEPVEEHGTEAK